MPKLFRTCLSLALLAAGMPAVAAVSAIDDAGKHVSLPAPAKRIISLAPHATELLFAAGAGPYVVGVSQYSDYPSLARNRPMVGGSNAFDIEKIVSLKPDLAVVWRSGTPAERIAKLRAVGITVFESEPRNFSDIASSLERLSLLTGTAREGQTAANAFRQRLSELERLHRHKFPVRVFYQIWHAPLMTLNGSHMVSEAIKICGGQNIFASLRLLAPTVSAEAVLEANPEAIIAASGSNEDVFAFWRRFEQLEATKQGNLFTINADWMNRAGPRILDGTESICRQLEQARRKRSNAAGTRLQ